MSRTVQRLGANTYMPIVCRCPSIRSFTSQGCRAEEDMPHPSFSARDRSQVGIMEIYHVACNAQQLPSTSATAGAALQKFLEDPHGSTIRAAHSGLGPHSAAALACALRARSLSGDRSRPNTLALRPVAAISDSACEPRWLPAKRNVRDRAI